MTDIGYTLSGRELGMSPPDPFTISFCTSFNGAENAISFYKDGRVRASMPDADEASRVFLDYLEKNYKEHIKNAEYNGKMEATNELQKKLSDPSNVYMGILRGEIAKPTWEQICHLYQDKAADSERLRFLIDGRDKWNYVVKQDNGFIVVSRDNHIVGRGKTAIEAIDNARSKY